MVFLLVKVVVYIIAFSTLAVSHPFNLDSPTELNNITDVRQFLTEQKRGHEGTQVCVQYTETSPSNIQDTISWFKDWSSNKSGYLPSVLQEEFAIPKAAFNCPGPDEKDDSVAPCMVVTKNNCFDGQGTKEDINNAWDILILIARYRILRVVLEATYSFTLVPPNGDGYGQGLVRDFAQIVKDFFNGGMGDSVIPGTDFLNIVGSLFLFAPYNVANSSTLFNANLAALQAADSKAFQNCNWYDLGKSTDCLSKPGFNAVWGELNKLRIDFDESLNWVDVASDMAPLSVPLSPDLNLVMAGYKDFNDVFQRAIWMQVQRQQDVFFHVQQYDLTADDSYWDILCPAIVSDITGSWCKNTTASPDNHKSLAYYPVQIHNGENNTVSRDYTAFNTISDYNWDPHKILGQSHRCADLNSQTYDLKPSYPQIFDMIRNQVNAASWIASVDRANLDWIDCLWSLPMLHFSEGPDFYGSTKAFDTLKNDAAAVFSINDWTDARSPRVTWKDDNNLDYKVWQVIRDDRTYCPKTDPDVTVMMGWGIVEGDDQFLADLYASQQLVRADTNASTALEAVHQAACEKQISDTYTTIMKEAIDLMINVAAGLIIPEGGWVTLAVLEMSWTAATLQTFADDYYLQPWLDKILRQQFTLTGDAKTEVEDYLTPYLKTEKPGEGIE